MANHTYKIILDEGDHEYLLSLSKNRTIQAQVCLRAKILLQKEAGKSDQYIADGLCIDVNTVRLCINKYLEGGIDQALFDRQRKGRPAEITSDAIAWIIDIACQRPFALGYSQELWTMKSLHKHIQEHAREAGFPRLETVSKTRIQQILKEQEIKPFKIKYYCEKRDPDFETKMHNVLLVYKQVELQFDENGNVIVPEEKPMVHTLSCDEKPGIQAISTTGNDLRPRPGNGEVWRDYVYKRLGTVSLLAAIDLLTGEAFPLVRDSHKSEDFIDLLKMLDAKYPEGDIIRIVLDNHSIHRSKKTQDYLATLPEGCFEFIFTPTHGSWLNVIEGFFSKMTKQMLRGIRVNSKEELAQRIYMYFDEINADPIVYHWTYKMDEIKLS